MKPRIQPLSILATLAGLALVLQSSIQPAGQAISVSPDRVYASSGFWPPRPDRIVHLSSRHSPAPQTLSPQQLWSAMFVPPGNSLVITNASILGEDMSFVEGLGSAFTFKRAGEAEPQLRSSALDSQAPLGWVFRGGSQVAFRNDAQTPQPLEYELVGYLVAD